LFSRARYLIGVVADKAFVADLDGFAGQGWCDDRKATDSSTVRAAPFPRNGVEIALQTYSLAAIKR
jgi:hypothetical protein